MMVPVLMVGGAVLALLGVTATDVAVPLKPGEWRCIITAGITYAALVVLVIGVILLSGVTT